MSFILLTTFICWISFAAVATWIGDDRVDIPWYKKLAAYIFVIFIDVPYNVTTGSIILLQMPKAGRLTFTARVRHILLSGEFKETEWRWKVSYFMCKYLISPWDFNHCGLGLGK